MGFDPKSTWPGSPDLTRFKTSGASSILNHWAKSFTAQALILLWQQGGG